MKNHMASNRKAAKGASAGSPRSYSDLYRNSREAATNSEPAKAGQPAASTMAVSRQTSIDWRGEYGHVLSDLRRLGLISGVLIVAMIIAGYFL
jgi:hypothetical protein